ncbi:hypothetical protein AMQ83_14565 [Paenibacillus riograndensis]|nr:hypothetical protein AMQ83_14565 [Paenibacillus riograndensis]
MRSAVAGGVGVVRRRRRRERLELSAGASDVYKRKGQQGRAGKREQLELQVRREKRERLELQV